MKDEREEKGFFFCWLFFLGLGWGGGAWFTIWHKSADSFIIFVYISQF